MRLASSACSRQRLHSSGNDLSSYYPPPAANFNVEHQREPYVHLTGKLTVQVSMGVAYEPEIIPQIDVSTHEMPGHDADELARRDRFGSLPERWEMPLLAGHQIVGA